MYQCDEDFDIGDQVIVVITKYDYTRKLAYGKNSSEAVNEYVDKCQYNGNIFAFRICELLFEKQKQRILFENKEQSFLKKRKLLLK